MTIELDTTLAQAEVLFLSFSQLLADLDRRRAEDEGLQEAMGTARPSSPGLRKRTGALNAVPTEEHVQEEVQLAQQSTKHPIIDDNLRELLKN